MNGSPFEIVAGELEIPDIGRALGDDPVRQRLGERAEDRSGQEVADDVASRDRRRRLRVEDASRGGAVDRHRPETPSLFGTSGASAHFSA